MCRRVAACVVVLVPVWAQSFPLPASAGNTTPTEATAPFVVPMRVQATKVVDRTAMIARGLPSSLSQWDMIAVDPAGRYLFVTAEQTLGAAVFRHDTGSLQPAVLLIGNGSGLRSGVPATWSPTTDDFRNLDPCLLTPWGTLLTGEEADGGRAFEIMNPFAASGPFVVHWRSKIPAATFEGMRFDAAGTLYFSDEDNSGSIYKFVPSTPGSLAAGQTFVLRVDAFLAFPGAAADYNWDSQRNRGAPRTGPATWVPITDAVGNALTIANPFQFGGTSTSGSPTGGRLAADEVGGTPYGRCEDMDIGRLANGREVIYSALTNENRVLSIELVDATHATVRVFADFDSINFATGTDVNPLQNDLYTPPGNGTGLHEPDNLAVDAFGGVYIVEDAQPGDLWKAIDLDRNGVAEGLGLFASLGVAGAEPSGLVFDPRDPYRCYCNVLGPSSGNSALWSFQTRPYRGSGADLQLAIGVGLHSTGGPGEAVREIRGGELAQIDLWSRGGTLAGAPFLLLIQAFATAGAPPHLLPGLWLNPLEPMAMLAGGDGALLPAAGHTTTVLAPPGLLGWSIVVQGVAATADGALVLTDGGEYVMR